MLNNGFAPAADKRAAARALDVAPCPFAFAQLLGDFLTLDGRRPPAMNGLTAIPINEMTGLGHALYGPEGYAAHEIETLLHLDSLRLRCANDKHFVEKFFERLNADEEGLH